MQFQADLAGVPVVRAAVAETTALGAAYLAGLATGFWPNETQIDAQWIADRTFTPSLDEGKRAQKIETWRRAVERAKGWAE